MQNSSSSPGSTIRTDVPRIPDHEVLRCIGKGSYGEVWLARSLTGSLRAAKVVRREDFELDRTFEREFEGITRFEPISRDHPGLVHILHVGRSDEEGFYYYLMELGDDRETGSRVEPGDYEARTMGTDRTMRRRLPVQECVHHGIVLADALAHLHEHGLTHRDIKPSNIIFVNGKPKLADIGLVAAAGQMTFVGTEGFVPPEGPGTAAADIYSLGMVLYEMSTGNDRLQFPELPDDLGNATQRPMWRSLNDVVCKACAPAVKKRYSSARLMAEALRNALKAGHGQRRWMRRLVTLPVTSGVIAFLLVTWRHGGTMPWPPGRFSGSDATFLPLTGSVSLSSDPSGADIIYDDPNDNQGDLILAQTPATVDNIRPGSAFFTLRRNRYRDATLSVSGVTPGETVTAQHTPLQFFDPPRPEAQWTNSLGMPFDPRPTSKDHISRRPVSYDHYSEVMPRVMYADVIDEIVDGEYIRMVRVPPAGAVEFCDFLALKDIKEGFLPDGYCYRPEAYQTKSQPDADIDKKDFICFRLIAEKAGGLIIDSDPRQATIYDGDVRLEVTPFEMSIRRTGPFRFTLKKEGFQDKEIKGEVVSGKTLSIFETMERSLMPMPHTAWQNSLGMKFQPVEELQFCVWETRIKDYTPFAAATGRKPAITDANNDGVSDRGETEFHPAVNVTRADAIAFCQWLTEKERKESWLPADLEYRLPTDPEWSLAAGSKPREDESLPDPAARHNRVSGVYPWQQPEGITYPPPLAEDGKPAAANLGDITAFQAKALGDLNEIQIKELEAFKYVDGTVFTAAAGSYRVHTSYNLFDLSGNVWEFVADDFGDHRGKGDPAKAKDAVTRGASWADPVTRNNQIFGLHFRRNIPPAHADDRTGFRIVMAPVKQ